MARMPRGEPRSVPDSAGDLYDKKMAGVKAQREAEDSGLRWPLDVAQEALQDFQSGPKIQRPDLVQSFIPVVGPAWEAAADLQDGNYAGAAFNATMAVADALPAGAIVKGVKAASKGIGVLKGPLSANQAAYQIRKAGLAAKGQEIHHTVPLKGASRSVPNWRNNYALLKPLPEDIHRRLRGSWKGKPRFDPVRRVWYGTTDWQKSVPTALTAYAADAWENVTQPFGAPPAAKTRR